MALSREQRATARERRERLLRLDGAAVDWAVVEALLRNAYVARSPSRLAAAVADDGAPPASRRER